MSPLQDLFEERRKKCEADQVKQEAEEKATLRAKIEAIKQAALKDPKHPKAVQANYAEECKKGLEEEKRFREAILRKAECDRQDRKEVDEREKAIRHRRQQAQNDKQPLAIREYAEARRMRSPERALSPRSNENNDDIFEDEGEEEDSDYDDMYSSTILSNRNAYKSSRRYGGRRLGSESSPARAPAEEGKQPHSTEQIPGESTPLNVTSGITPVAEDSINSQADEDMRRSYTDRSSSGEDTSKTGTSNKKARSSGSAIPGLHTESTRQHSLQDPVSVHAGLETPASTTVLNLTNIPEGVLIDVLRARATMHANNHELVVFLTRVYRGLEVLSGMVEGDMDLMEQEGVKIGLDAGDERAKERFVNKWESVMTDNW